MTVRENMGFALKLAGTEGSEIDRKVEEAAEILDLEQHLDRRPANLSGGQRQRVAMGRAIVRKPKAFLLDEPLSNLDAKLRVQMRTQLARLQSRLGTTTFYVTHDQTEAMTLGDRVAVMRAGELQQVGSPADLYNNPRNLFVAGFIGSPAMNFMPADLRDGRLRLPIGEAELSEEQRDLGDRAVIAGLRPESFEDAALVGDAKDSGLTFSAKLELVESMGSELYAYFTADHEGLDSEHLEELAEDAGAGEVGGGEGQMIARLDAASQVRRGEEAELWAETAHVHLFDPQSGESLAAARPPEGLADRPGEGDDDQHERDAA
jgi:multiple sugar transport system ATP-binding protein